MKLPLGFGEFAWGDWFHGLIAAALGGGATAVVAMYGISLTDPAHPLQIKVAMSIFGAGAFIAFMSKLSNRSWPEMKKVETTVQTSVVMGVQTGSTTIVKETEMKPVEPTAPPPKGEVK